MAVPFIKTSWAAGELSPSVWGHVDLAKYAIGASTMRNMFVSYRGGGYSRAGTAFVDYSKQTGSPQPPRLITFQFNINQGLALEFGNGYMRVISNGAYVTDDPQAVTGITQASPGVATVPGHGYSTGDWIFFANALGMTQVNGQTYVITVIDLNRFSIADVFGNPIDTAAFQPYTGGATAARIFTLTTPWSSLDLAYLKFTQSADTMSICNRNQASGTEYPSFDLRRLSDNQWVLTQQDTTVAQPPPGSVNVSATRHGNNSDPTDYPTAYAYVVTAVDKLTGEESIASPVGNVTNGVDISLTAGSNIINWAPVGNPAYYNIYKAQPSYNTLPGSGGSQAAPVPLGSQFGFMAQSFGIQFVDSNIVADFSQVPPVHINPFSPGQILGVNIVDRGAGLTTVTWAISTTTGDGFTGYPIVVSQQLVAFVITNPGRDYAPGDSIIFNGAGFASGAIVFGVTNPSDGDTVTFNGFLLTFKTTVAAAQQIAIGTDVSASIQNLVAYLNASGNSSLTPASYQSDLVNGAVDVTYDIAGNAGNSYTLAASAATPSGSTLSGGSGTGGTAPSATLTIGPQVGTFPSVVAYFQQRRVYANTANNPDTYFMTQPGLFQNFDRRIPTIDTDAITGTPWSVEVNGIQWMIPMPGGLVVLTGLAAWQLTGAGGSSLSPQPITPANQQAQPQAYNGAHAFVTPIRIDFDIYYLQAKGSIIRDLSYNFFLNIYTGVDITYLSSHLFLNYLVDEMAWCEEPYKVIWVVRDDGALLSFTNLKTQEIQGWARHDTQGLFVSCCSVTEPPVDALYVAVQRYTPNGVAYTIERMDNRLWTIREDAWTVDAGLRLPMLAPDATLVLSASIGPGVPTSVQNLVGGSDYSDLTTAMISDPTGSGATASVTVTDGVVTAVNIVGGSGYTYPLLQIVDPANSGSGASGDIVLNNPAEFFSSSPVFTVANVGDVVRGPSGHGKATVTAYVAPNHVTVQISEPFPAIPNTRPKQAVNLLAGNWTITTPVSRINGLNHLIGMTVTGLADGAVITPRAVDSTGGINLDVPASAVTVGLGFTWQLQGLPTETGNPTIQGRRKKIAAITARVEDSAPFQMGSNQQDGSTLSPPQVDVDWVGMTDAPIPANAPRVYGSDIPPLFSGDVRIPILGGFGKPGQPAMQQTLPLPVNISAVIPELLAGDTPELQAKGKDQKGGQQ